MARHLLSLISPFHISWCKLLVGKHSSQDYREIDICISRECQASYDLVISFDLSQRSSKMEGGGSEQKSTASATTVFELPGEPAIVINGVPDIVPSDSTRALCNTSSTAEAPVHSGLGEWLEGREVLKLFMGRYYTGVVLQFDKQTGWFRVLYEDGDSEDLDWQELEEILLPLDVTIPLKSLAQRIVSRKSKKPINKPGKIVSNSQNPQVKRTPTKAKMITQL